MAEVGVAFVSLLPETRNFGAKMQSGIGPQIDGTAKKTGSRFGKIFASTTMGPLRALGGAALGFAAFSALKNGISGAVEEAREAQVVGARTANVLRSMGLAGKVSADDIGRLAMSISNKTAVDDEAIQSGMNLLLTFREVGKTAGQTGGVFEQATALAVDMSKALGVDMKSASLQLGKALNDPLKGVTALTRSGVSFSAAQKEQITNFVETGRVAKAQAIILAEVRNQFGGAAAAMATPADRARVAWANFQEQVGTLLLPLLDRLLTAISGRVIPAISTFVSQMQSGSGAGGAFAAVMMQIWSTLTTVASVIASVVGFLNQHRTAVIAATVAIAALVAVTQVHAAVLAVAAAGGLVKYAQGVRIVTVVTRAWAAVQWAMNAALVANPIGATIAAIALLVAGVVIAYKKSDSFRAMVDRLWAAIKVAATWVSNIAKLLAGLLAGAITAVIGKVQDMIGWVRDKAGSAWDFLKDKAISVGKAILEPIQWVIDKARDLVGYIGDKVVGIWDSVKTAGTAAFNAIRDAVQWVIDKVGDLISKIQSIPGIPGGDAQGSGTLVGGVPRSSTSRLSSSPLAGLSTPVSTSRLALAGGSSGLVVVEMGPKTLAAMQRMDASAAAAFAKELNNTAAAAARGR